MAEKNVTGFIVKELDGSAGAATFDWMVVAKRRESLDNANSASTADTNLANSEVTTVPPAEVLISDNTVSTSTVQQNESATTTESMEPILPESNPVASVQ